MNRETDNTGTLGRNKRQESENQPTHSGSCIVQGRAYWISAYVNKNRTTGEKFFKLYFKPQTGSAQPADAEPASLANAPEYEF